MNTPPPSPAGLPDYDRLASAFDRWLPLIEPVGLAVLDHLPALSDNARVLDVACGTGEPGLTLARRSPGVHLLGVDAAAGMIEVARAKAAHAGFANVRFEVMAAENLSCAEGSMDALVSRFGLLMFGDVATGARELARVLRVGGHFSLAVWDDPATNILAGTVLNTLRPYVSAEAVAFFDRLGEIGAGERLREAGITDARSEAFRWNYGFESEDVLWQFIAGPGMFTAYFARLGEADTVRMRSEIVAALLPYQQADGRYQIPHTCRLWWGEK